MRHQVRFERRSTDRDAFGTDLDVWAPVLSCFADMSYARGTEAVSAAREAGRQVFKVRIHATPQAKGLTPRDRMALVSSSQVYNIQTVDAVSARSWVYLTVEGPQS